MSSSAHEARSNLLLAKGAKIALQARQKPLTARVARTWLARAAGDAGRRDDISTAKRLSELEASIL